MGSRVRIPPSPPAQRAMLLSVALFLFRCAGGDGEPEPLRGLELHAIVRTDRYVLTYFCCRQSLKGESLRPTCNRDNTSKRCLFSFRCAGGERGSLRGLELHAIVQPCCYILIRFACHQSLKGESLRPACNRDNTSKRCLFSFRCASGDGEPEPLRGLELHAIERKGRYFLTYFCCRQSLKGESLRPYRMNCQVKCNTFCNSYSNKSAGVWKFSTFFGLLFIFATFCASVFAESGQRCT